MLKPGDQIGPYFLIRKLGTGGSGVVWLAEQRGKIAPKVALKIPLDDEIDATGFLREAELWVEVAGHPNVLPIFEAAEYDGQLVIVSEFAPEGTLADWLRMQGGRAPTLAQAVDIVEGILDGLIHLHARNMIHRDLKPQNILLQGRVPRLADFGIARVVQGTRSRTMAAGTPVYMAPEAFDGRRTEQTDLWAVGVILYELISGSLPFLGQDIPALLKRIVSDTPLPLPSYIPSALSEWLLRALQKRPSDRFRSAVEMKAALSKIKPLLMITEVSSMGIFDVVLSFFKNDDWPFSQPEGKSLISTRIKGDNGTYNCIAQAWEGDSQIVVFYATLPQNVPENQRMRMAEFITRANYGLRTAAFEMDFTDGEVRCRTGINVRGDRLSEALMERLAYGTVAVIDKYLLGMMATMYTNRTPKDLIDEIEDK